MTGKKLLKKQSQDAQVFFKHELVDVATLVRDYKCIISTWVGQKQLF